MDRECERARQWASSEIDGELSEFEGALLRAHLAGCSSCSEFSGEIGRLTQALRAAPLATLERPIEIGRVRRRRLRLAPAAAAMAAAAVGLGSLLASSHLPSGSVGGASARQPRTFAFDPDTRHAKVEQVRERVVKGQAGRTVLLPTVWPSTVHGGPVLADR